MFVRATKHARPTAWVSGAHVQRCLHTGPTLAASDKDKPSGKAIRVVQMEDVNGVGKLTLGLNGQDRVFFLDRDSEVEHFVQEMLSQTKGIQNVSVTDNNDALISLRTPVRHLLHTDFNVNIDGETVRVVPPSTWDSATNVDDIPGLKGVLARVDINRLRQRVIGDPRQQISLDEFLTIASDEGVDQIEARRVARYLHHLGLIMHFPDSKDPLLANTVVLKPQLVIDAAMEAMDIKGHHSDAKLEQLYTALEEKHGELEPLNKLKLDLDTQAASYSNRVMWGGLAFLGVEFGFLARLTWWEFSWDIMEPITYFIGTGSALVGYWYFTMSKREYGYENFREVVQHRRAHKLYDSNGLDLEEREQLIADVEALEQQIDDLKKLKGITGL